jgi:transcriptional antiterminator RfaH
MHSRLMITPNWLLLQVKPRQELRALENLERQKGDCYCPQIQVDKLSRGKRIQVEETLFPGYLFINAQPEHNGLTYTSIRSSRGVSKIVCFGAEPIKIPEALIQQLKLREQGGVTYAKAGGLPQSGDKIDILEGPFEGLQAVYSRTDGRQRSIVLINLLHQKTPLSLANTQIKKLT